MLSKNNILFACAWALTLILAVFSYQVGYGNLQTASLLLSIGGFVIVALNWHEHRGGRSASFIFLVLGYLFLCGRAFPALVGEESQLAKVGFGEFVVATDTVTTYVFLVLTSFFFVHVGSILPRAPKRVLTKYHCDAKIYWMIFILLLPAYVYKNAYYFNYIMTHGGYLAIYQDSSFIEGVGTLVRVGALMCLAAFTLYFYHEADEKKSRRALIYFVTVFASELLVGLRGKFFVVCLIFFLFYKLRFGGKFHLRGLLILLATVVVIAIGVEIAREQKGESTIGGSFLVGFLVQQGVTAGVSLIAMSDSSYYDHHAWSYFWHQFVAPFYSQSDVPMGWFLANDIAMRNIPTAYALGFGTGSSYLAELLLLGGWVGVCVGSLAIGWLLSTLGRFYQGVSGAVMFWVVCGVAYYPRTMLQDPVHNLMRYAVPTLLVVGCCRLLKSFQPQGPR